MDGSHLDQRCCTGLRDSCLGSIDLLTWEESEEARIKRLMSRGSGEGLMEIDEGILQICL